MKILFILFVSLFCGLFCIGQAYGMKNIMDTFYIFHSYKIMADKSETDQYLILNVNSNDSAILTSSKSSKSGIRYYSGFRFIIPSNVTLKVNITPAIKINKNSYRFNCDTTIYLSGKTNSTRYFIYKETKFGKNGKAWIVNLKKVLHCRPAFISADKIGVNRIQEITSGNKYVIGEYNYELNRFIYFE